MRADSSVTKDIEHVFNRQIIILRNVNDHPLELELICHKLDLLHIDIDVILEESNMNPSMCYNFEKYIEIIKDYIDSINSHHDKILLSNIDIFNLFDTSTTKTCDSILKLSLIKKYLGNIIGIVDIQ